MEGGPGAPGSTAWLPVGVERDGKPPLVLAVLELSGVHGEQWHSPVLADFLRISGVLLLRCLRLRQLQRAHRDLHQSAQSVRARFRVQQALYGWRLVVLRRGAAKDA